MTLHECVGAARATLRDAGLADEHAGLDAEVLARLALGWDRAEYLSRRHEAPPPGFDARFAGFIARRAQREPVAQIAGRREFWTREFEVTRDVLTPRPETELIVEEALAWHDARARRSSAPAGEPARRSTAAVPERWPPRIVDVGTGSGCLAITLALELDADIVATDISAAALAVARRNAARLGAHNRVRFVRASLLEGLARNLDLIVSNPPYVPHRFASGLSSEVRDYEPAEAVFGGHDGFELIDGLLAQAAVRLAVGGRLLMEFGAGQDDDVRALVNTHPLVVHAIRDDLQGIPRMAVIGRRGDAEVVDRFAGRWAVDGGL